LMAIYSSIVNKFRSSNHSGSKTACTVRIVALGLCITTLMCCCLQVQLSMSRRMPWVFG